LRRDAREVESVRAIRHRARGDDGDERGDDARASARAVA
jgi:hypothetical protein